MEYGTRRKEKDSVARVLRVLTVHTCTVYVPKIVTLSRINQHTIGIVGADGKHNIRCPRNQRISHDFVVTCRTIRLRFILTQLVDDTFQSPFVQTSLPDLNHLKGK